MVVKASEVCQACDRVDALMLGDFRAQHSPNGYAEAIHARSSLIPGQLLMAKCPVLHVKDLP